MAIYIEQLGQTENIVQKAKQYANNDTVQLLSFSFMPYLIDMSKYRNCS